MTQSEREFTEMMFRRLKARRGFPQLDVGSMPELSGLKLIDEPIKNSIIREFERST